MKKFLVALMISLSSLTAFAEASFDQIQGLIQQGQYQAAEQGLEVIIKNHPQSAKAFYAMAQAQAGLGNLEKAKKALDIATGLNPTLDFAPASSVASLREAITPQVKKIEAVETSHFWRNFAYFALFSGFAVACYFLWSIYSRKQEEEQAAREQSKNELRKERETERKTESVSPVAPVAPVTPVPPVKKTKAQLKEESDALALREATARAERAEAEARAARSYSAPQPTVVHTSNSGVGDFATGMILGNMMGSSHHHHDTERTVVRETIREVPTPSRDSSWDDTPSRSSSRSSSWDDDSSSSSSKRSSSWDDSSSSSSSSWSSSSSSDSSSSWDSSSSSSSDSSSSW